LTVTTTPSPSNTRHAEGEALKLAAHALLAARREVYVRRGRRALLLRLLAAGTATADDVRDAVELPPGINPKLFGAVPGLLAAAGIIEAVGYTRTARKEGHARPVLRWRLADRAAALAWLGANPDLPDLEPANSQPTLFAD
jgi:hypothetical protein